MFIYWTSWIEYSCGQQTASTASQKVVIAIFRVYLVDNSELELQMTETAFAQLEKDVKIVGTSTCSETAMKEILDLKPNLVITDLYMRQMGGIGLMNALKAAGADCEFIILSHSWSPEAMRKFIQSGGYDFLLKPLDLHDFQTVLRELQRGFKLRS